MFPLGCSSSNCSDKIICSKLQVEVRSNSSSLKTGAVSKQVLAKLWFCFGLGLVFVGGYWLLKVTVMVFLLAMDKMYGKILSIIKKLSNMLKMVRRKYPLS